MRVLLIAGKNTIKAYNSIKQKCDDINIELDKLESITDIKEYLLKGGYFNRVVVLEKAWSEIGDGEERVIRRSLGDFVSEIMDMIREGMSGRGRSGDAVECVMIARSEGMAKMAFEESFDIASNTKIVLLTTNCDIPTLMRFVKDSVHSINKNIVYDLDRINNANVKTEVEWSSKKRLDVSTEVGDRIDKLEEVDDIEIEIGKEDSVGRLNDIEGDLDDFDIDLDETEFNFEDEFESMGEDAGLEIEETGDGIEEFEIGLVESDIDEDEFHFEAVDEELEFHFEESWGEAEAGDIKVEEDLEEEMVELELELELEEVELELEEDGNGVEDEFGIDEGHIDGGNIDEGNIDEEHIEIEDEVNNEVYETKVEEREEESLYTAEEAKYLNDIEELYSMGTDSDTENREEEKKIEDIEQKDEFKKVESKNKNRNISSKKTKVDRDGNSYNYLDMYEKGDTTEKLRGMEIKGNSKKLKRGGFLSKFKPRKEEEEISILDSYKKRGGIIVVTGASGSGKTVVASNIANVLYRMGYTTLIADFDTEGRGQAYISKDNYDVLHEYTNDDMSLIESINSVKIDTDKSVHVVGVGKHLIGVGLRADKNRVEELVNDKKINRFINIVKAKYNFTILDIPFEAVTGKFSELLMSASIIINVVEASTHGAMKFMIDMGNIENMDIMETMFKTSSIVVNKVRSESVMFGKRVEDTSQMLEGMDNVMGSILETEAEYRFSEMEVSALISDSGIFDRCWFTKEQVSDTEDGYEIFKEVIMRTIK